MDELPARLAALVGQARTAHDPSADDARRVGEALSASIPGFRPYAQGAQPAAHGGASASSGLAPRTLVSSMSPGTWALWLSVVTVVAIGSALATLQLSHQKAWPAIPPARHAASVPTDAERPPGFTALTPAPVPTPPVASSTPALPAAALAAPLERARATARPHALATSTESARSTRPQLSASDASEELALIRQASQALRDHQPAVAWQLLQRHATRFPAGMLTQERTGLTVIALCERGHLAQGRALRRQFLITAPESPLAGRVRNACAGSESGERAPLP
jgi:hypothetical protein